MNAVLIRYTLLKILKFLSQSRKMCEFRGFRGGAVVDFVLDKVESSLLDNLIPKFRENVLS